MNEADRIAQAMADRVRADTERLAPRETIEQRIARNVADIKQAIPTVLAKLEVASFPGVTPVEVHGGKPKWRERKKRGNSSYITMGGWLLCNVHSPRTGELTNPYYLLSDGRLCIISTPLEPEGILRLLDPASFDQSHRARIEFENETAIQDLERIAEALRGFASGRTPMPSN